MTKRDNHYEAAFEAFLRAWGVPYVAVDETRRAVPLWGESIKCVDFIVSPERGPCWLVDVKGRRFPAGHKQKQYWRNWSTRDDLVSLTRWETYFGPQFKGLFLFAFEIVGDRAPLPPEQLFSHRERLYGFLGVALADYRERAHVISPRWETLALSTADFRQWARPAHILFDVAACSVPSEA